MKHRIFTLFCLIALILVGVFHLGWIWFGLILLMWLAVAGIGSGFIWSQYHVKAHLGNPMETERKIALTFDDGPSEFTPKVLDLLNENGLSATFFCIGQNVKKHPEIARRIISEGHLIANHSYSHSKTFDFFGTDKVTSELQQTDAVIKKVTGKKPIWFRPPYGVTTPSIAKALRRTKHEVIGWNIRSNDGVSSDVKKILYRIEKRLKPGGIVLMHDTSMSSIAVLEQLLLTLRRQKYTVVSLSELLDLKAYG